MKITVKEPITGTDVDLNLEPEDYNGEQGLRVIMPDKDSFVIVQKDGEWQVMDDDTISPDILEAISKELQEHGRYNTQT